MCRSQKHSEFGFNPGTNADEFAKLWKCELRKAKDLLAELERPIGTDAQAIQTFISRVDEFDFSTKANFEVTGSWKWYTSDEALLKESQDARSALHALLVITKCSSAFALNIEAVFQRAVGLDHDTVRLLTVWKDALKSGGAALDAEQKAKVLGLTLALDELENTFRENLKKDNLRMILSSEELEGLPKVWLDTCKDGSELFSVPREKGDVLPILTYCSVQETREKAFRHLHNTATENGPLLERILRLRQKKASALDFQDWAPYVIGGTMVNTPANVEAFLDDVQKVVDPLADKELEQYSQLLARKDCMDFHIWDLEYGQTLLKKNVLPGFDPGQVSEYFPVDKVIPAMQELIGKLFNLRFEEMKGLATWEPRVTAYKV